MCACAYMCVCVSMSVYLFDCLYFACACIDIRKGVEKEKRRDGRQQKN